MRILEFVNKFSDEKACKTYFKEIRMKQGVTCKKCGGKRHYWLRAKWQFQCSACDFRTTLRSGTVMEKSRLPFRTWFLVMLFMTSTRKGFSARELQRQIGHKRYMTIWSMMHKLRDVMGKRDDLYRLTDMVEFDEGFFETEVNVHTRSNLKRGKGSERQVNVAVMAESVPLETLETGEVSKQCRFFKMKVLNNHTADAVESVVEKSLEEQCIVFSDSSNTYFNFENYVEAHFMSKSSKDTTISDLKWVHIAIGNAKRNFLGVYHKIKGLYLQNYLNEFVYKLNRRYFDSVFERLLVASVYPYWYVSD